VVSVPSQITSVIGLFVILAGLVLYRYSSVAGTTSKEPEELEKVSLDPNMLHSDSFNQRLTHQSGDI
jgi:hypothetical protein